MSAERVQGNHNTFLVCGFGAKVGLDHSCGTQDVDLEGFPPFFQVARLEFFGLREETCVVDEDVWGTEGIEHGFHCSCICYIGNEIGEFGCWVLLLERRRGRLQSGLGASAEGEAGCSCNSEGLRDRFPNSIASSTIEFGQSVKAPLFTRISMIYPVTITDFPFTETSGLVGETPG